MPQCKLYRGTPYTVATRQGTARGGAGRRGAVRGGIALLLQRQVNECTKYDSSTSNCADQCVYDPGVGWKYAGFVWIYSAVWLLVQV